MKPSMTKAILMTLCILLCLQGCVYNVRRPLDTNYDKTEIGTKVGMSKSTSVLWLFAWGDAGTKAAAEDGDITVIEHADTEVFSILFGLYTRVRTVVYGN
ncbi:MAG: TRL domain-containing protein [bacterium]